MHFLRHAYEYESVSYRDPQTGRVRTRQTYRGRIDPVTGELIPKGEGKRKTAPNARALDGASESAKARIAELEAQVVALRAEVDLLRSERAATEELRASLEEFARSAGSALSAYDASQRACGDQEGPVD